MREIEKMKVKGTEKKDVEDVFIFVFVFFF